jgi:hypothetical protein
MHEHNARSKLAAQQQHTSPVRQRRDVAADAHNWRDQKFLTGNGSSTRLVKLCNFANLYLRPYLDALQTRNS